MYALYTIFTIFPFSIKLIAAFLFVILDNQGQVIFTISCSGLLTFFFVLFRLCV